MATSATRAFHTGDVFGTVAMVQGAQHGATYLTESKCRLLKLHREDFLRLEMTHPGITNHIRKLADERHDDMD